MNSSIDESYLDEIEKEDDEDVEVVKSSMKSKKKCGRRGKWSSDNLDDDDFIDIIVNNNDYVEKLIFRNTKFQHNGIIYEKILKELKKRSSDRGETIEFDVNQLRNKFKKCVGDCKKIALTIKTATGIKKIQREKGYGSWFDQLFAIVKTRDSCKPEKAIEPSANNKDEKQDGDVTDDGSDDATTKKEYVPIRSKKKNKQKEQEMTLSEVVNVVKNMVDQDPMKDLVSLVKEEMKESREHELKLYQLMFNSSASNSQAHPPNPDPSQFFQHNSYYHNHGFPRSCPSGMNPTPVPRPEAFNIQQNLFADDNSYGSPSVNSSDASNYQKRYQSL